MRRRYPLPILPLEDWPARDRAAWEMALRPAGLLEDRQSLSRYPAIRIRRFAEAWGRWLGYLRHEGAEDGRDPASGLDYLCREHLQGFLDLMMAHLASCSVRSYLTDLWTLVHHMDPEVSHEDLHQATLWIWRTARPEGNKMQRIVPARELYALGFDLMERAEGIREKARRVETKREGEERTERPGVTRPGMDENLPQRTLERFRDGLMIAMLAARPLRIRNFAQLELDRHVFRLDDRYRLMIAGKETKARRVYEIDLPDSLTAPLDFYIAVYRPRLLERRGKWSRAHNNAALWISRDGAPYRPRALSERISAVTARHLGHPVNPHLFRDCAATSIAVEAPEAVGIIAPVLGHANTRTGERHYNQARSMIAGRAYLDVISSLREETL